MRAFVAILLIILFGSTSHAGGRLFKKKEYQTAWCAEMGGEPEVILDDKTRVDCLTDEYAIEVDFASKWAEATGQALYYSLKTGRRPGVLLIMEKPADAHHRKRLQLLAGRHNINIWETAPAVLTRK